MRWQQHQIDMLVEIYGYRSNTETAAIINAATGSRFTETGVKHKFNSLKRTPRQRVTRPVIWNSEREALLLELCKTGKSAAVIADEINAATGSTFTRNAICGAIARRGLHIGKPKTAERRLRTRHRRLVRTRYCDPFKEIPLPVAPLNIPFVERDGDRCRFPTQGAGSSMLVCGQPTSEGISYCAWHCSLAYQPSGRAAA